MRYCYFHNSFFWGGTSWGGVPGFNQASLQGKTKPFLIKYFYFPLKMATLLLSPLLPPILPCQCLSVYVDLVDAHSFLPEHVVLAHLAITLMNRDPVCQPLCPPELSKAKPKCWTKLSFPLTSFRFLCLLSIFPFSLFLSPTPL